MNKFMVKWLSRPYRDLSLLGEYYSFGDFCSFGFPARVGTGDIRMLYKRRFEIAVPERSGLQIATSGVSLSVNAQSGVVIIFPTSAE